MKTVHRLLFALHLFVGIGAVFGGAVAIINPYKPLGVPVEALNNSPFDNYLIPGIILFAILGIGNIFGALIMRAKLRFQGYISSVFSWAIMIWIVVQCIMLKAVAAPHVIYFMIGAVMALLSAILLFEQRLFPTNIVFALLNKLKLLSRGTKDNN